VDVYAELVNFYSTYYSANIMKFAIIGRGEASPPHTFPLPYLNIKNLWTSWNNLRERRSRV